MILLSKNLMIKMAFPTCVVFVVGSWNVLPNSDLGQLVSVFLMAILNVESAWTVVRKEPSDLLFQSTKQFC